MDEQLRTNRIHVVFREALNWDESKIQRHLCARASKRRMMMGLVLALLSKRIKNISKAPGSHAFLESPVELAEYVYEYCQFGNDEDRAVTVFILCEIGEDYRNHDSSEQAFEAIDLLVLLSAKICKLFKSKSLLLVSVVRELEFLALDEVTLNDFDRLGSISQRWYKQWSPQLKNKFILDD